MDYQNVEDFKKSREQMNEIVLKYAGLETKRFFNLDTKVYNDGALSAKVKELLGLTASMVLRCDDCIKYHMIRCFEEGVSDAELEEALSVSLIVGGSIVIPHLRRAYHAWEELKEKKIVSKPTLFKRLMLEIDESLVKGEDKEEILNSICETLQNKVEHYDWVGFYLVDPEKEKELYLETFVGEPTDHTRIPFGEGICGQAADRKETFLVDDVTKEDNYLSCSVNVKSEIVVPIMDGDKILGELDIDSHVLLAFDEDDQVFLEEICKKIVEVLASE